MRRIATLALLAACSHEIDGPAPSLTAVEPGLVCNVVTTTLTATGAGLSPLAEDALTDDPKLALPSVTLRRVEDLWGNPVTDDPITLCPDTTDTSCTLVRWVSQTTIEFDITPELGLEAGVYEITVANANGKSFTATVTIEVVAPPELTEIIPNRLCTGGGDVVITGTGFSPHASATIGGQPIDVTGVTPTELTGTLGSGLDPGTYDVVVDNGAGCIDTLEDAVTIVRGPAVYYVDPPVDYNGISIEATVYVSGIDADPASVAMRPNGTMDETELEHTWDPAKPNRILATIPAGLSPGSWDFIVDDGSCQAILLDGVTVTDTLTIGIDTIDPPFGWTSVDTAVTITAVDPAPAGLVQFQATPRAYLNPDVPGPAGVARAINAVAFVDETRLTAIVPDGLAAGLYDLIIINPDGTVGLLDQAFTVTDVGFPPPTIDNITPGSVVNQPAQQVTITGDGFRDPTVTATCQDDAGALTVIDGVVVGFTDTSIDVTFDMGALVDGAVCVIRVTNGDGTYADFSALAVSNPAQNLPATVLDDDMVEARRALAATAARVTAQARYVFAIGGDDGTAAGLLASVEAAPVDLFGRLSAWSTLPLSLPEGRSRATAVAIGRFIYLAGGRTATGATDSVLRAQVLDPRAAPEIVDLGFDYGQVGLGPGLLYYRVSAVMDAADESNPGGETLASDPLAVIVPPAEDDCVILTVYWDAVPGAVRYRIYRTPGPDMLLGDVRLVGEVEGDTQFVDDGTADVIQEIPLPTGALGVWHEVGPLSSAREGAGVAFARDPDAADAFFLYAIGGRDAGGTVLADYDVARIVDSGSAQAVDPFASGGPLLVAGRWELSAMAMGHDRASVVPAGETWIYAMAGLNAAGSDTVRDVTAAKVGADGALGSVFEVDDMPPGTAGYGVAAANNFLFAFGGAGSDTGTATAGTMSSQMCAVGDAGCGGMPPIPEPPDLVNWNSIGFTLQQARYLPGSALESAFIFLCGGSSDTEAATATVERTHW